jgi:hypothetical protein
MVRGALLDDDQFIQDDFEPDACRRFGLWFSCCFFIGGAIIGGIVLVLWTVHLI